MQYLSKKVFWGIFWRFSEPGGDRGPPGDVPDQTGGEEAALFGAPALFRPEGSYTISFTSSPIRRATLWWVSWVIFSWALLIHTQVPG